MRSRFARASSRAAVDAEHVAVRLLGLLRVAELLLEDPRETFADARLNGRLRVQPSTSAYAFASCSQPPSVEPREALDVVEGFLVDGDLLQHTNVDRERGIGREQLLLRELRQAVVQQGDPRGALGDVSELGLEDVGELLPLPCGFVQRLEDLADLELAHARSEQAFERLTRGSVIGRRVEHVAIRGDRGGHVVEAALMHLHRGGTWLERSSCDSAISASRPSTVTSSAQRSV
jgi:hypothetical protein